MYALSRLVSPFFRKQHDFWPLRLCHALCRRHSQCDACIPDELRNERVDDQQGRLQTGESPVQFPGGHDTAFLRCGYIQETQSYPTDNSSWAKHVLPDLPQLEATAYAPLQYLQRLCAQNGPPLSLDWQLCRLSQLQGLLPFLLLLGCKSFLFSISIELISLLSCKFSALDKCTFGAWFYSPSSARTIRLTWPLLERCVTTWQTSWAWRSLSPWSRSQSAS